MKKIRKIIFTLLFLILIPSFTLGQSISDLNSQLNETNQNIDRYQDQISSSQKEAVTLESQINAFNKK